MKDAKTLLYSALNSKSAIGQFNISNLETFQAAINASKITNSPIFLGTSNKTIEYMGIDNILALYNCLDKKSKVLLHLDHGTYENAVTCIKKGYPSVMFDGSMFNIKKNIMLTKKLVRLAKKNNVCVEGELGSLCPDDLTSPIEAKEYAEKTGIDSLAVSVGNQHGYYKYMPVLDFKRLNQIAHIVNIPLVLHGGSGLIDSDIKTAITCNVAKINIDTELRWTFTQKVQAFILEHAPMKLNKETFDPRNYLGLARSAVEERIVEYINMFKANA